MAKENLKDFVHEALDIDRSFFKTFVHLFTKPEQVTEHREAYMKPWQYALYVVSISCLFMWFIIHLLADPTRNQVLWDIPKRILDLDNGYASFYENSQPIKRLMFGSVAMYLALLVFFFKKRNSLVGTTLYLVGHSLFLQFLVQAIRVMILGGGFSDSGDVLTSMVIRFGYISYAVYRVFHLQWKDAWKAIPVFILTYALYAQPSTYGAYHVFYTVMNRKDKLFQMQADAVPLHQNNFDGSRFESMTKDGERGLRTDSLTVKIKPMAPRGEVAKLFVSASSTKKAERVWSATIFEKIDRYSPDSTQTFLAFDNEKKNLFAAYRISNDSNAAIHVASLRPGNGQILFSATIHLKADDIKLKDITTDSSYIYLVGSARDIFSNVDLGMILIIDKESGQAKNVKWIGEKSFASKTSFESVRSAGPKLLITARHEYKKFVYFRTTEWFHIGIDKKSLN